VEPIISRRHAAVGAFWSVVERAATQGTSFLVVLVLARLLGPSDYGLVALAATIALLGQMLLGETFSQALIQQKMLEPEHTASLFWMLLSCGAFGAIGLALASNGIAFVFGAPALAPLVIALSPLLVLSAMQAVPAALFKRTLNFRALAAASASGTIAGGVAGLTLAWLGFGPWSLIANLLVQNALVTLSIWRQSSFRPAFAFSPRHFGELWGYGRYTFLLRIAAFAANQSPRLIVGYFFGSTALGAFSLGLRIIEMLYQLLVVPAVNVTMPVIANLRDTPKRLERTIAEVTQMSAMVSVPVFVMLALVAPYALPLAFGAKWTASATIVRFLCLYGVVGSCGLIWGSIIGGLGRPDVTLATTTTAALVSVAVLLLSAPWGPEGAAAAFVIRGYVTLPFMPLLIARITGNGASEQYAVYWPILAAVGAMAAAVEGLLSMFDGAFSPVVLTAVALIAGAAVYGAVLSLLAGPALRRGAALLGHLRPREETP
jgi:PST family polysaccharide transporter